MAKKKTKKRFFQTIVLLLLIAVGVGGYGYQAIFGPEVQTASEDNTYFYIKSTDGFDQVVDNLESQGYLLHDQVFIWVAQKKNYVLNVKPGRYTLSNGLSIAELVDLLRRGEQTPVNITFNNVRTLDQLAGRIAGYFESDSAAFQAILNNDSLIRHYGFNRFTFACMFVPNTYQMYWNTSPIAFVERMAQEYKRFWNDERRAKAQKLGLDPTEVVTLASIVQSETSKIDEMPKVAGVYLNRLRTGMKLQADPTLVFAAGDFTIRRVLDVHKQIDSPYNTYMYSGLPPGPIRLAEIQAIDAVLNAERHEYLYFCADSDFSGYHVFARNYAGHLINARKYHRALSRSGIYR